MKTRQEPVRLPLFPNLGMPLGRWYSTRWGGLSCIKRPNLPNLHSWQVIKARKGKSGNLTSLDLRQSFGVFQEL